MQPVLQERLGQPVLRGRQELALRDPLVVRVLLAQREALALPARLVQPVQVLLVRLGLPDQQDLRVPLVLPGPLVTMVQLDPQELLVRPGQPGLLD